MPIPLTLLLALAALMPPQVQQSTLPAAPIPPANTFTNPLLPRGPDPWVTYQDGFYYYMNTTGTNLTIWKTRNITDLRNAQKTVVWTAPADGPYSHDIWAPELHYLRGAWYIYFAADAGDNDTHRLWVLENRSRDPLTNTWTFKGKLTDESDRWAIDPSVFENKGKLYLLWSGWEGAVNGTQNIYLARLRNPWTVQGKRLKLSTPTYPWERVGDKYAAGVIDPLPHVDVNEGPEMLEHGDRLFMVYSASGCWTDYYELGMLTASTGSNLMKLSSWTKSEKPVFLQSPEASVYGPGHNSFFKSPDGTQDWILYHANTASEQGCGSERSPRAQPITWRPDGTPDFGRPLPVDRPLEKPSGEQP